MMNHCDSWKDSWFELQGMIFGMVGTEMETGG